MSRTTPVIRKPIAAVATLLLAAAGLSLGAGTAEASTSASSVVKSAFTKVDAVREAQPGSPAAFGRNGFLDEYAGLVNSAEAAHKGKATKAEIPDAAATLQAGYETLDSFSYVSTGSLSGSTASKIAAAFDKTSIPFHEAFSSDNYAAISVKTSKGKIYAEMVVVDYESAPLDRIVASKPTISGTPTLGKTLSGKRTVATPGTTTVFQWFVDGDEPVGTGSTFVPLSGNSLNHTVTVRATTSETGFADSIATSAPTRKLAKGTLLGFAPSIQGSFNINQQLTAVLGFGEPTQGTVDSYVWFAGGEAIGGATDATYTVPAADEGKTINVRVTIAEPGFTTIVRSTTSTTKIGGPLIPNAPTPTITDTTPGASSDGPTVGDVLTASEGGDWAAGTTKTWQWKLNGKSVAGATTPSFTLPPEAYGFPRLKVTVTETGTLSGFAPTPRTSDPTPYVIGLEFTISTLPEIPGTVKAGTVLKVNLPDITPTPKYTYAWIVANKVVSKKSTYKVPKSVVGKFVQLILSFSKPGYVDDSFDIAVNP